MAILVSQSAVTLTGRPTSDVLFMGEGEQCSQCVPHRLDPTQASKPGQAGKLGRLVSTSHSARNIPGFNDNSLFFGLLF